MQLARRFSSGKFRFAWSASTWTFSCSGKSSSSTSEFGLVFSIRPWCLAPSLCELLDLLDTLTPKSLRLNNNILAPCKIVTEFVNALHHTETHDPGRRSAFVFRSQNLLQVQGVAVRYLAGSPFHTDAIHLVLFFSEASVFSKKSNSALALRFQCLFQQAQHLRSRARHQFVCWHCRTL